MEVAALVVVLVAHLLLQKPDDTANTEPEGGCGEGMKWDPMAVADNGKKGACVEDKRETEADCTGDRKWDPLAGELCMFRSCITLLGC